MGFETRDEGPRARASGDSSVRGAERRRWPSWLLGAGGVFALLWFLIRVIPKPSRATYPCQRVAFPIASAFVLWLAGVIGSIALVRRARRWASPARAALVLAIVAALAAGLWHARQDVPATSALAVDLTPNAPIGVAKGIHPGRVVWVHDPDATNWAGPGNGYWWESRHTDQTVVDRMMDRAIRTLAGEERSADAWDRIFRHFNKNHGRDDRGYRAGEKIMIKVNYVGCIRAWDRRELTSIEQYDLKNRDYMHTSPQMIIALLGQLRDVARVKEEDITVGDTLCYFPTQFYEMCRVRFPRVRYLDYVGKFGRIRAAPSEVPVYWSSPDAAGTQGDLVPAPYAEADYLINLANLKSHNDVAGITLCAKNHYGSLGRTPVARGYFDLHEDLPFRTPGMGHYRPLVDLMGHAHYGGKTLLYLIDGLYAGKHAKETFPRKWNTPPFDGDWTSSLFASQDPVAIDSVGFDLIRNEWDDAPHTPGTHDYLVEAALADKPPSGTFYDPNHEGNVSRLSSLGVYEHWNNPKDKQYSRNLKTGEGIELVRIEGTRGGASAATASSSATGSSSASNGDAASEKPEPIPLWPAGAPGETDDKGGEKVMPEQGGRKVVRLTNVTAPTLTIYRPADGKANGAAMVICPGGGYRILAMDLEGEEIAEWLTSIGVTGILLKYRVPPRPDVPRYLAPLQDAQRAVSTVRARAKAWGIDPARIGIMGFSAGGHLSAAASTNYAKRAYEPVDEIDEVSCRPDFTMLIYPAYLIDTSALKEEARAVEKKDVPKTSPELPVTAETPPMILIQTGDDGIKVENSLFFYLALKNAGVPAELHLYPKGGHGYGLRPSGDPVSGWPKRCEDWLRNLGVLNPSRGRGADPDPGR